MSSLPVTSPSYRPVAQTDLPAQRWENTSSKYLRWKVIKTIGIAALSNLPGIIAIGYGAYTISDVEKNQQCWRDYFNGNASADTCSSTALSGEVSVLSLIFGLLYEAAALPATCRYAFETGTEFVANSPSKIIELRNLISSSCSPKEFIRGYDLNFHYKRVFSSEESQLARYVNLGILSQERVDQFDELLKRNTKLTSEQNAIENINDKSQPFMMLDQPAIDAENERLALEEQNLKTDWEIFKKVILSEIPNQEWV